VKWNGPNSLRFGLLDDTVTEYKRDLWQVGWAILGHGGSGVYVKGSQTQSLVTYTTGDTIGFALDMSKRQCTFYRNGTKQGIVFSGLPDRVWPAISNGTGTTSCTSKFGLPFPKDA